jgi:tight adherence protein C
MVVLLAALVTGLALAVLVWVLLARPAGSHRRALANLQRGLVAEAGTPPPAQGGPPDGGTGGRVRRLAPGRVVALLERLLARAGRPSGWTVDRLLVVKVVLPLLSVAFFALLAVWLPGPLVLLLGALVTVVAHFLPELLLHSRGIERSEAVRLALADTLDQMTIAVEAGLGFDAAIARAGRNGRGPLAEELVRTLQDIQVGRPRRQAYEDLARRTNVPALRRFVRAVIQADLYGISVADVLRTQAQEMRLQRRQRAEEKAMQVPVKVIFPLLVCILPVLFIVLLGPAAINVLDVMRSM